MTKKHIHGFSIRKNIPMDTNITKIERILAKSPKVINWLPSWKKWPPSWIFKCSLIWIWRMPQNHLFCANNHASVSIINYVDKWICENGIFDLGDLYDLENDLETQNWQWHPPTSFLSSYEWLIPRGCQLLTNDAVKNISRGLFNVWLVHYVPTLHHLMEARHAPGAAQMCYSSLAAQIHVQVRTESWMNELVLYVAAGILHP